MNNVFNHTSINNVSQRPIATNDWKSAFDNPNTCKALKDMSNNMQSLMNMNGNGKDPLAMMLDKISRNNPQLAPILGMVKNGSDPSTLVRQIFAENGINEQEFMSMLQSKL